MNEERNVYFRRSQWELCRKDTVFTSQNTMDKKLPYHCYSSGGHLKASFIVGDPWTTTVMTDFATSSIDAVSGRKCDKLHGRCLLPQHSVIVKKGRSCKIHHWSTGKPVYDFLTHDCDCDDFSWRLLTVIKGNLENQCLIARIPKIRGRGSREIHMDRIDWQLAINVRILMFPLS